VQIEGYRRLRQDLEVEKAALADDESEAERWLETERSRGMQLRKVQARQRRVLNDLQSRRTRLLTAADRLARKGSRLERLMQVLSDEATTELEGVPIQDFQGALDWPAAGSVEVEFGPRRDPTYRTTVPHNGIELTTTAGDRVRAVYGGRVLFAAPFQDLGFTVVVEHPGRALTLYAGLSEVLVREGDVLALAGTVGVASARLYFEIRVEKLPQNPRDWLL
jgi:septal ring factor EnvC (AmiA/AmiB activator)